MSKILVSILSDHIVPNYLYYKELGDPEIVPVFLQTDKMEAQGAGAHLEKAMGFSSGTCEILRITNDNYLSIQTALDKADFDPEDEYIINLTGGTKIMALAVYDFFKKLSPTSKFVYIPYGTNKICDINTNKENILKYRLSIKEYLTLYGLKYESKNPSQEDIEESKKVFSIVKEHKFWLTSVKEIYRANENFYYNEEEKKFYSGIWFENYVYDRIKNQLGLKNTEIAHSLKLYREKIDNEANSNEYDVVFIKDNILHVIECKVSMKGSPESGSTHKDDVLYKMAASIKDMGLRVNSYLCTLDSMKRDYESVKRRMKILGINNIFTSKDFAQKKLEF